MSNEPEVLTRLKNLQPGIIYSIAPKSIFLMGFEYYRDERLRRLSWVLEKTRLKGIVHGAQRYIITVSTRGKHLQYRCNCPEWRLLRPCKHIICTLLTIFNLISPDLFKVDGRDQGIRNELSADLFGKVAVAKADHDKGSAVVRPPVKQDRGVEIVIDLKGASPAIFIRKKGRIMSAPFGVPLELAPFIHTYYSDKSLRDRFVTYVQRSGSRYPLVLETGFVKIPLEWDSSLKYQTKTELDISAGQIEVRALSLLDGKVCEKVYRFWDFVIDPEKGKLGQVVDTAGWSVFNHLNELYRTYFSEIDNLHGDPGGESALQNLSFHMPMHIFQAIQLSISKPTLKTTLGHLVLKLEHQTVSPQTLQHRHRLTIDPDPEGKTVLLRAECCLGSSAAMTSSRPFSFFSAINDRPLPSALRALKRLTVLYDTFFHVLSLRKKEDAAKAIRKALSKGDFLHHEIKSSARNLLKEHFALFKEKDVRLRITENNWAIVPNEKEKEIPLYQVPYQIFGPKIFREMQTYNEMILPAKSLYDKLSRLHASLERLGIDLYYKQKPVATAKWDFAFDAKRHTGIDWFELKPEIRCDGVLVDDVVWKDLLQQRGIVEQGETLQIVDSNTQQLLKTLSLIYKGKEKKDPQKKEIVEVPRLQILDWIALRSQGVRVTLSDGDEALIQSLTNLKTIDQISVPDKLNATLRPYQKEGLDWLAFLYRHRFGACLADDMGLGKTIQAIAFLAALKEGGLPSFANEGRRPHLIIVPPTLLFNWEHEIGRFYPQLKVHSYVGKDRKIAFEDDDIVLTTYALVRRDISRLKEISFDVIVFDEAQAVKNLYAETTGAVRQLQGLFKLVMTGTPVENHLGEYFSLIDLCLPGLLGEYDSFKTQIKRDESTLLPILIRRTRPFVLRRMKSEILKELPPKTETDLYLNLTVRQKALYQETIALIRTKIDAAYQSKTGAQAKIIALTAIMKLRQLCVSPRLILSELNPSDGTSPKLTFLIDQLQALFEEGHSALVFSQFTRGLDLMEEVLRPTGIPYSRLDGSTPTKKRKKLVEKFQESEAPAVFLLSLKAGGQGLNLTKASYVFHLDPWWNPAVENQATDRAHRIGQTNKVSITRILMRHTIEEKMMLLKKKKLALYDAVMGGAEEGARGYAISKSDFDFLLGG